MGVMRGGGVGGVFEEPRQLSGGGASHKKIITMPQKNFRSCKHNIEDKNQDLLWMERRKVPSFRKVYCRGGKHLEIQSASPPVHQKILSECLLGARHGITSVKKTVQNPCPHGDGILLVGRVQRRFRL